MLFRSKEIYATAAAAGATVYVLLHWAGVGYITGLAIAGGLTFGIRAVAIAWSLSLPTYKSRPGRPF